MSIFMKRALCMGVLALFCFGLCRAALFRFREKEDAIRQACRAELQKMGASAGNLRAKYPTPEIHMVSGGCLVPGQAAEVVVKGTFAPGTKFVFENDNLAVVKESLVGNEYRATLKVAPGIGPQNAALTAISPGTCVSARKDNAVVIRAKLEWAMEVANGWKLVARPVATKACGESFGSGDPYEMLFYRKGEANPFEKLRADLFFSMYESTNYRFTISQQDPVMQGGAEDAQALMQKMMDPKLTDAQREQVIKQVRDAQVQMQANMKKMLDPSYAKGVEAKRQEFGCERIELKLDGSAFHGNMRCSQKVGMRLDVTGAIRAL